MPNRVSLPQYDSLEEQEERLSALSHQRDLYKYDHITLSPLPIVKDLPSHESFDFKYIAQQVLKQVSVGANGIFAWIWTRIDKFDEIQDFQDLFLVLRKPITVKSLTVGCEGLDREFGRQRLAGVNPMVIRRIDTLPDNFPLEDATFQQVSGTSKTLNEEISEGRLYLADYAILDGVPLGSDQRRPKFLTAPIALYRYSQSGNGRPGALLPVAIQLGQRPEAGNPIFTPLDGPAWAVARTFVQAADANHHEMSTHLGRTHLLIEPFVVSAARQLAPTHPISVLLKPHFRFTLAINAAARKLLINPGGFVDRLLAGTLEGTISITRKSLDISFHDLALLDELGNRGVNNTDLLPDYPYRDDAKLVWNAITVFVEEYLKVYYLSDTDVGDDHELQGWLRELTDDSGGRVRGVTRSGKLQTRTELRDLISQIIFTCGPQHAAINFSQYDNIAFAPNMPLACYSSPPTSKDSVRDDALFWFLPPRDQAMRQIQIISALTAFRYNQLGKYDKEYFQDPKTGPVTDRFQARLREVEGRIDERNLERSQPYHFLKPSLITSSINI